MSDGKVEVHVTLRLTPDLADWLTALALEHGNTTSAEASLLIYNAEKSLGAVSAFKSRRANGSR